MPQKAAKKKSTKSKSKRTQVETKMTVKVNGKPVIHPVRKFLIAISIILFPLCIGLISSAITGDAMINFSNLKQPPLTPPAWLFPVVWSILYLLMGVASYLICRLKPETPAEKNLKTTELVIYFTQLAFNFFWTIFFFKLELRFFAFGWLIAMWLMILTLIIMAFKNHKAAAWCFLPYLFWCTFAAYLNIIVAVLN